MLSLNQRAQIILNYCANPSASPSGKSESPKYSNQTTFEYSQHQHNQTHIKNSHWLSFIPLASVLFAIFFTQSILLLASNQPLNILLMLGVLILMPWTSYIIVMLIKSKWSHHFSSTSSNQTQLMLVYIKRITAQSAFMFALSSWVCIWLNLLVKDVPLGWSSTFSLSATQLTDASRVIFLECLV